MGLRRLGRVRRLPAVGRSSAARCFLGPVHPSAPGQVGAHRPVEAQARSPSGAWRYLRFWMVKTLIRDQPAGRCSSAPRSTSLYLRALGAKIGRGVTILSRNVPVCTDLLTIGARHGHPQGLVVHRLPRRRPAVIQTGRGHPRPGRARRRGDGARHRHRRWATGPSSATPPSLHTGQAVPAGERWHGSPAQRTDVDYRPFAPARLRRAAAGRSSVSCSCSALLVAVPAAGRRRRWTMLLAALPLLDALLDPTALALTSWAFYRDALVVSRCCSSAAVARRPARSWSPCRAC